MTAVRVACLLALLGYTFLFVLVFQRARPRRASRYFLLYLLAMIVWQAGQTVVVFTSKPSVALLGYQIIAAFGYSMGFFYAMFVRELLGVRSGTWIVWLGYTLTVALPIYLVLGGPGLIDAVYRQPNSELYLPTFGPVATAAGASVYAFLGYAFFHLLRAHGRTSSAEERNRLLYLLIGISAVMLGSLLNFSPALRPYPMDILANMINAGLTALAILRYRLFDIRLVVRKGLRYSVTTAIVGMIYFLLVSLSVQVLHLVAGYQVLMLSLIMAAVAAVAVQPLRDALQGRVDKRFFRERYDLARMLERLSTRSAALLNVGELTNLILAEVTETIHIERAAFFLKEPGQGYAMVASHGLQSSARWALRDDHPIVVWVARHPQVFLQSQLDQLPLSRAFQLRERDQWETLGPELLAPIVSQGELVGLLAIGPKRSGASYTADDRAALVTLSNQAAVSVENARLYSAVQHELEERERTEQLILQSLHEKEVLLKEIHHRVKNNLQVIYSLLSLQAQYAHDQGTLEVLRDSQNRIRSMALIHEKLYQSENLADIDFGEYLRTLSAQLHRSYSTGDRVVRLIVNTAPIRLPLDMALPCALIASELIANALKHAFVGRSEGVLRVRVCGTPDGVVELEVADDGVGMPKPVNSTADPATLGMQLVGGLVKQLDGSLEVINGAGTCFLVSFQASSA